MQHQSSPYDQLLAVVKGAPFQPSASSQKFADGDQVLVKYLGVDEGRRGCYVVSVTCKRRAA
eukprot:364462-Chlamydomonas_euryale.AAC.10